MGCGESREKLEDELMKLKMARIELQMERYNQLKLLKDIDGKEVKVAKIPDYIDQKFLKDYLLKRQNSNSTTHKDNSINTGRKQKRSKTCDIKRKISNKDKKVLIRPNNGNSNCKRKTLKL